VAAYHEDHVEAPRLDAFQLQRRGQLRLVGLDEFLLFSDEVRVVVVVARALA
jgi:hypothetical protein